MDSGPTICVYLRHLRESEWTVENTSGIDDSNREEVIHDPPNRSSIRSARLENTASKPAPLRATFRIVGVPSLKSEAR